MTYQPVLTDPDALLRQREECKPLRKRKTWIPYTHSINQNTLFQVAEKPEASSENEVEGHGEAAAALIGIPFYIAAVVCAGITASLGAGMPLVMLAAIGGGIYGAGFAMITERFVRRYAARTTD